jgi:iduronate 2-sulfatase
MGFSMVTARHHYVEWRSWDNDKKIAGDLAAVELYDNQADPDENFNIAVRSENAGLVARLADQLRAGWRAARP